MPALADKLKGLGYEAFLGGGNYDANTLNRLPELIGSPLPEDYLQFLAQFPNTGIFEANIVCAGVECAPCAADGLYPITHLYASSTRPSSDLLGLRKMQEEGTRYLLFIGVDVFGNYFCLDLRRESFGKIYFWFHEERLDKGLYLLADDFTSFINSLRADD